MTDAAAESTTPEEDAIYRQIGRFVVVFQALETELLQLGSFAIDPEHTGQGRHSLADLFYKTLVDRTGENVSRFLDEHRPDVPEFRQRVEALLVRCRELGWHRNKVLHSAYLSLEAGGKFAALVRSDMRRSKGDGANAVVFDDEVMSEASLEEAMVDIADVALGIVRCRQQLIHWHRP
jgi:hypothetical protein